MPPKVDPQIGAQGSGTTTAMPGTGTSLIRPLRAWIEYNGLMMNLTQFVDKYRITRIDGLDDPDVKDDRDEISAADGEIPLDAFYKGRGIQIAGRIEAHSAEKLDDMREALSRAFGVLEEMPLTFYDPTGQGRDFYLMCRKTQKTVWTDELKDYRHFTEFLLSLRASNYRKIKLTSVTANKNLSTNIQTNTILFTITNLGSATAQPLIRLTGGLGGTITVLNVANGQQFQISGGITNGSWIEVDVANKTVKNELGQSVKSKFSGKYLEYEPGDNQLLITTTAVGAGTPKVNSTHSDSYL